MSDEAPEATLRFTALETKAIDAICETVPEIAEPLQRLLATARLTERDNSGHGFFTSFEVDASLPAVTTGVPIMGPEAEVQVGDDVLLMGFLLWLENGYPNCLEGFQYCTADGRELDLSGTDLGQLEWLRTLPSTPV